MATFTTTAKHALRWLTGGNIISDIDAGFQALAEDLDAIIATADSGVLASRPTSTGGTPGKRGRWYYATDTAQLFFDYGTGWLDVLTRPTVVQTMPTLNLYLGQIVHFQSAAMLTAGVGPWICRWVPSRWKIMAADPLLSEAVTGGAISTTGAFADLAAGAGAAPSVVIPWLGDYWVEHGCESYSDNPGVNLSQSFSVGATAPLDYDAALRTSAVGGVAPSGQMRGVRKNAVTAAAAITLKWKIQADVGHFEKRWLKVTPLWF